MCSEPYIDSESTVRWPVGVVSNEDTIVADKTRNEMLYFLRLRIGKGDGKYKYHFSLCLDFVAEWIFVCSAKVIRAYISQISRYLRLLGFYFNNDFLFALFFFDRVFICLELAIRVTRSLAFFV